MLKGEGAERLRIACAIRSSIQAEYSIGEMTCILTGMMNDLICDSGWAGDDELAPLTRSFPTCLSRDAPVRTWALWVITP